MTLLSSITSLTKILYRQTTILLFVTISKINYYKQTNKIDRELIIANDLLSTLRNIKLELLIPFLSTTSDMYVRNIVLYYN